ncbi:MAG: hypothetical protein FWE53_04550 [Firmicutes bacterium]|nr:hypothetical protein [Bacillota bacterium]
MNRNKTTIYKIRTGEIFKFFAANLIEPRYVLRDVKYDSYEDKYMPANKDIDLPEEMKIAVKLDFGEADTFAEVDEAGAIKFIDPWISDYMDSEMLHKFERVRVKWRNFCIDKAKTNALLDSAPLKDPEKMVNINDLAVWVMYQNRQEGPGKGGTQSYEFNWLPALYESAEKDQLDFFSGESIDAVFKDAYSLHASLLRNKKLQKGEKSDLYPQASGGTFKHWAIREGKYAEDVEQAKAIEAELKENESLTRGRVAEIFKFTREVAQTAGSEAAYKRYEARLFEDNPGLKGGGKSDSMTPK